jgi:hypothetical protein
MTPRLTSAETRNSTPMTIMIVEAVRALRKAAKTSTAAVSTETVDSSPLDDRPSTRSPSVEKKSSPPAKPRMPKTPMTAATARAPTLCTKGTRRAEPSASVRSCQRERPPCSGTPVRVRGRETMGAPSVDGL